MFKYEEIKSHIAEVMAGSAQVAYKLLSVTVYKSIFFKIIFYSLGQQT